MSLATDLYVVLMLTAGSEIAVKATGQIRRSAIGSAGSVKVECLLGVDNDDTSWVEINNIVVTKEGDVFRELPATDTDPQDDEPE